MPFASRRADLLERSLQGLPGTDREVRSLAATASRIPALTSAACRPRDDFVSALGLKLRAEALTLPVPQIGSASSAAGARRSPGRPVVLVIGRGLRVLAGATASVLLIGAILGVTSRSALPGGLLYPVKEVFNSAAVQLAGSDFDRGVTLLSQAQEHIGDARSLVERDRALADAALVNQALLGAESAVTGGQRALLGEFDRSSNAQALIAVQDFAVRALPQLNALRTQVPASSRPDVDALIALLHDAEATVARQIAACGQPCASLGGARPGSPYPSAPASGPTHTLSGGGLAIPGVPAGGLPVVGPSPAITGPGPVVVGPTAPPLPFTRNGFGGATVPPVSAGSITVSPSSIVIPPVPHLSPKVPTPVLLPAPTGLQGLP
jgi:hypothetical protein